MRQSAFSWSLFQKCRYSFGDTQAYKMHIVQGERSDTWKPNVNQRGPFGLMNIIFKVLESFICTWRCNSIRIKHNTSIPCPFDYTSFTTIISSVSFNTFQECSSRCVTNKSKNTDSVPFFNNIQPILDLHQVFELRQKIIQVFFHRIWFSITTKYCNNK